MTSFQSIVEKHLQVIESLDSCQIDIQTASEIILETFQQSKKFRQDLLTNAVSTRIQK